MLCPSAQARPKILYAFTECVAIFFIWLQIKKYQLPALIESAQKRVVLCAFSQVYHKVENTHMAPFCRIHFWYKFSDGIKLFQIQIQISNFEPWFKISNKLKWIFKRWYFSVLVFGLCELCLAKQTLKNSDGH